MPRSRLGNGVPQVFHDPPGALLHHYEHEQERFNMAVLVTQESDGTISLQPESFKKDGRLAQWLRNTIDAQLKYENARNGNGKGDDKVAKATLTRPDGTQSVLCKAEALKVLKQAEETWRDRALTPAIDPDLKVWLNQRADAVKDEIRRLNGEDVPER